MKRNALNLLSKLDNASAGLISLEALEKVAAQLPAAKRTSRVTIGSCRPTSPHAQAKIYALKRDVALRYTMQGG